MIRDFVLGLVSVALIALGAWVYNRGRWEGVIDERIRSIQETVSRIERKVERLP